METLVQQATRIHTAHVMADGTKGHTGRYEWRNCQQEDCQAFRDSMSSISLSYSKRIISLVEASK